MPTLDEIRQAQDHLVTVGLTHQMDNGTDEPYVWTETVTGILEHLTEVDDLHVTFSVTTGYEPGHYDVGDEVVGARQGLHVRLSQVREFTDHGERSDFQIALGHLMGAQAQALKALKDAEANLQRHYATVTNLTAQEG